MKWKKQKESKSNSLPHDIHNIIAMEKVKQKFSIH